MILWLLELALMVLLDLLLFLKNNYLQIQRLRFLLLHFQQREDRPEPAQL